MLVWRVNDKTMLEATFSRGLCLLFFNKEYSFDYLKFCKWEITSATEEGKHARKPKSSQCTSLVDVDTCTTSFHLGFS